MLLARMGVAVFHYEIGGARSAPVKLENLTLAINQMVKEVKCNIFHYFASSSLSEKASIVIGRGGKLFIKLQLTLHRACCKVGDLLKNMEELPPCFWDFSDPLGIPCLVYV